MDDLYIDNIAMLFTFLPKSAEQFYVNKEMIIMYISFIKWNIMIYPAGGWTSSGGGNRWGSRECCKTGIFVLYCTVLYFTVLYCTALYCTILYCTVLYFYIYYK